ncbi:M10 family metallopeptidase C-terminal domain-containing protein [Falsiroseomonas oryzae]|uniref:M10 family metallopeptidase C-terminal domain-containing protein n=1 Tax=Falsiroseomonas oryzae TaxID=2766473 RepID=UPI0022EB74CC|nr:M10 family metallopeptidase C-terminal domain-containing protein [Roseomonas sp. MO-31]
MSDLANDTTTGAVLAGGAYLTGTIDAVDDEDWIRVDVQAGETYRFLWNCASGSAGIGAGFALYDADGTVLVNFDNPGTWTWITIQFTFSTSGSYYLGVGGVGDAPAPGGYTVASNLITDSPTEAIDWGTYFLVDAIDICFAEDGEVIPTDVGTLNATAWSDYLLGREMAAFAAFAAVANLSFAQVANPADAELRLVLYEAGTGDLAGLFGFFLPPAYVDAGIGGVNADNTVWNPLPGGSVELGGKDFGKMLHEAGHALGLAHTHDNVNASVILRGVTSFDDLGDFDLNQSIYTIMSYNEGWLTAPHGVPRLPDGSLDRTYGYAGTPMALDIAVIQEKYGANMSHHAGDDLYLLPAVNAPGTFYSCIWDAGGHDVLSAAGAAIGATIDLRAATLRYEAGGGGWVSYHAGIHGGFTIANGVVIEDAIGSALADDITGNDAANRIAGEGGADTVTGGGGADRFAIDFDLDTATQWFRPNAAGTGGITPNGNAAAPAWRNYVERLAEWRSAMEASYGSDADPTETVITVRDGRGSATIRYDNSYTRITSVEGEGDDLVTDWEDGTDHLEFTGMTRAGFLHLLSGGGLTVSADADLAGGAAADTRIAWAGGSVTLQDVQIGAASLASGGILFA